MRFKFWKEPQHEPYSNRVVRKFLWWPKSERDDCRSYRWLEYANVVQVYEPRLIFCLLSIPFINEYAWHTYGITDTIVSK